jgi:hypothetical protein
MTLACRCSALTMIAFSSGSSTGKDARCTRLRGSSGKRSRSRQGLTQHLSALRVVGDGGDGRAGVDQVGAGLCRDVLGEAAYDPERVLERLPARHLEDDGYLGAQRLLLEEIRAAVDAPRSPVLALEGGGTWLAALTEHRTCVQHGKDRLGVEILVLGREDVERRRDHHDAIAIEALPGERLAGEHVGVGVRDVGLEEGPRFAR